MRQRGRNAQRLRRGVEHGGQPRSAFVVLLFAERPWLVLDDVFVDRRHQPPRDFQRPRKLKLIEQNTEFANRFAGRLSNRLIARKSSTPRATDTAPRP